MIEKAWIWYRVIYFTILLMFSVRKCTKNTLVRWKTKTSGDCDDDDDNDNDDDDDDDNSNDDNDFDGVLKDHSLLV